MIDGLAELRCSVTAREIADLLRERRSGVGLASIYRTLDLLDRLGLVQRFEVGEGVARYEPAHPGGDHHHHIVCDTCGKVEAFEDEALEEAIHSLSDRVSFGVVAHDVTLHGECPSCRGRRADPSARGAAALPAAAEALHERLGVGRDRVDVGLAARPLRAQRVGPQRPPEPAPDSRDTARSSFGLSELSGKIALTPAVRICSTSRAVSPDDGCAAVDSEGISAPITSMP